MNKLVIMNMIINYQLCAATFFHVIQSTHFYLIWPNIINHKYAFKYNVCM